MDCQHRYRHWRHRLSCDHNEFHSQGSGGLLLSRPLDAQSAASKRLTEGLLWRAEVAPSNHGRDKPDHDWKGVPRAFLAKFYPLCLFAPLSSPTPRPRGAAIRRCAVGRDGGGACGWSHDPLPGGFGAPPWGYYGPCARSSLKRSAASRLRSMPDETRRGDEPNWRRKGSRRGTADDLISAARSLKIADERSATGRADGGSIHPRRILAQWKRLDTKPRLAALRCPSLIHRRVRAQADNAARLWYCRPAAV